MRQKVWVIVVSVFLLGLGGYLYSENSSKKAVEEAMQQAMDACATGNRFLLSDRVMHAQSVFRANLSKSEAFEAESRLENRLLYVGCKL